MFATNTIHADDHLAETSDVAPPVRTSTTFQYPQDIDPPLGLETPWYSRISHPSGTRCEEVFTKILGHQSIVFASGLSAFHAAITAVNPKRVMTALPCYHGCHGILHLLERNYGLELLDLDQADKLQAGDIVHIETPVNPFGEARNIEHYAQIAHEKGAFLLVDATFAPPPISDPFRHGADIVMHSATKYFGGHSDLLAGVLAFKHDDQYKRTWGDRLLLGSILSPQDSWLLLRSLRSYDMRIQRQVSNADKLVRYLVDNIKELPKLKEIKHSSLQTEPWVKEQVLSGSPTFAIICNSREEAKAAANKVRIFHHCTSLGGIESMLEWRILSDDTSDPALIRISVGGENIEDLIADLKQALA